MMQRFKTLRVRFALWTSALLLAILALFGAYVYQSLLNSLSAALDAALTLGASQVVAALDIEAGKLRLSPTFAEEPEIASLLGRGIAIRLLSPEGKNLQTLGPYANWPAADSPAFVAWVDAASNTPIRVLTLVAEDNNHPIALVQVAQSLADMQATLQQLLVALLISVPLLVLIAGVGGYVLAARALAPIDTITRTARRLSAEDLSERLNLPGTDDEVGRLAATFDDMLARLDESFRRERTFTADASHELRTPLTAMQAILGTIRERPRTPADYETALGDLAEEADRLRTLTENLLRLARGEPRASHEPIDLSTLLNDVADSMQPLAEAKGLGLTCRAPNDLTLTGDRDDVIRLFVNLLDNAIKFTEHGGVTLCARRDNDHGLSVSVSDTGSGIPAEHLPHIFDRFYRVDESRTTRGAGLGLAIAAAIAHAHRGTIEARSTMGKGTTVTVRFITR